MGVLPLTPLTTDTAPGEMPQLLPIAQLGEPALPLEAQDYADCADG